MDRKMDTAMDFAYQTGVLETLGNLPEGFYKEKKAEIRAWAEEHVRNGGESPEDFYWKKIEKDYKGP